MTQDNKLTPQDNKLTWLVRTLLDYMQKPWQAIAIILLVIICGGGWIVWTERASLIEMLKESNKKDGPIVLRQDLLPEVNGLLNDTTVDLVSVWTVDFGANVQKKVIDGMRGGGSWAPDLKVLPVLTGNTSMETVLKLMGGQVVCQKTNPNAANLIFRRMVQSGFTWFCVVPIPPHANDLQIAIIYLVWKERPDKSSELAAKNMGLIAADRMTIR